MKIVDNILNFTYDKVVYSYRVKKIFLKILKSPIFIENPVYDYFYKREMYKKMSQNKEIPFRVTIENTNICKSNCTFCPHDKMERKIGFMDPALYEKIIDDCVATKIDYVSIYWFGEPLSDPKFIEKIRYAKEKGIKRVTTNTNLYFLSQKKAEGIIDGGLDEMFVSVDAAHPATYKKLRPGLKFDVVEKNIRLLSELKKRKNSATPKIVLCYVESEINRDETNEFIDKWSGVVDGISISQIHNWTGEIPKTHKEQGYRRKEPCRLLWSDMIISWDGTVPLCCLDYDNKLVLGDIKENSIGVIWSGDMISKIRNYHKDGEFEKISLCKKCEYNYHDKAPWWISK